MKVLIIIPAYNEGENIERVVTTIKEKCPHYDYIVINDDLSVCVNDVLSIIKAERLKYSNMQEKIKEIINNWFERK